jgi:hypothetical protein
VSVVKLDLVELREFRPFRVVLLEPLKDVLYGSTTEKVLLLEAQNLTLLSAIVGVKNTCNVLSSLALHD